MSLPTVISKLAARVSIVNRHGSFFAVSILVRNVLLRPECADRYIRLQPRFWRSLRIRIPKRTATLALPDRLAMRTSVGPLPFAVVNYRATVCYRVTEEFKRLLIDSTQCAFDCPPPAQNPILYRQNLHKYHELSRLRGRWSEIPDDRAKKMPTPPPGSSSLSSAIRHARPHWGG